MRLATVSEVPTPWSCLEEDLRQAGIDPARLDRIADRSMTENLNALSEGRIEAAQFFEPHVKQALASGRAQLWYAASTRRRIHLHGFRHDPGPACWRRRTCIAHGQGHPADAAVDL